MPSATDNLAEILHEDVAWEQLEKVRLFLEAEDDGEVTHFGLSIDGEPYTDINSAALTIGNMILQKSREYLRSVAI